MKVRIGLKNFNGAACGFAFEGSVAEADTETPQYVNRLKRLKALFPGSEEIEDKEGKKILKKLASEEKKTLKLQTKEKARLEAEAETEEEEIEEEVEEAEEDGEEAEETESTEAEAEEASENNEEEEAETAAPVEAEVKSE